MVEMNSRRLVKDANFMVWILIRSALGKETNFNGLVLVGVLGVLERDFNVSA